MLQNTYLWLRQKLRFSSELALNVDKRLHYHCGTLTDLAETRFFN